MGKTDYRAVRHSTEKSEIIQLQLVNKQNFPGGLDGKASVCNAGDLGRSLGWEDLLEKEMATHCSTIAWKIPWTEEPDRLQFMGLQRVGHS